MALPRFLQSCLWSYDLSRMDKDRSKELIITQVINYGNERQLLWMKENYSLPQIEVVVTHPLRGMWWREKLRYWLGVFGKIIDPLRFEVAIIYLVNPKIKLMTEFFKRVELEKHAIA